MFRKILNGRPISSAIELGAGVGTNLRALQEINPGLELASLEINETARAAQPPGVEIFAGSLCDFDAGGRRWDLAFTRGVLIHVHPEDLPRAYDTLYRCSSRYIVMAEYYNPKPAEVPYRGRAGLLWKRDFAAELMAQHPDLFLVDYDFIYHGDPLHPQDDITWFLLEKQQC